jgi:hypothetical protein
VRSGRRGLVPPVDSDDCGADDCADKRGGAIDHELDGCDHELDGCDDHGDGGDDYDYGSASADDFEYSDSAAGGGRGSPGRPHPGSGSVGVLRFLRSRASGRAGLR